MGTEACTPPDFPAKQCPCGAGACVVLISKTELNPGRKFYKCPARRCNFFEWCDTVTYNQRCHMPKSPYPMCSCGAGICSLLTVTNGEDVGRKVFVCPVRRGQGACNFFQWQDDLGNTVDNGNLDQNKSAISPPLILDSHGDDTETTDCATDKISDCNKLEGSSSPGLAERETMLPREHLVNEENAGFVSGDNEAHLPPFGRLSLNGDGRYQAGSKPGKCFRCGKEGHWMKECTGSPSSPSSCFKCGKIGHWMKDCSVI